MTLFLSAWAQDDCIDDCSLQFDPVCAGVEGTDVEDQTHGNECQLAYYICFHNLTSKFNEYIELIFFNPKTNNWFSLFVDYVKKYDGECHNKQNKKSL